MNEKSIIESVPRKLAGIIAIEILQFKYSRRGLELSPEAVSRKIKELEIELGYDAEFIRKFFFNWIVPSVLKACGHPTDPTNTNDMRVKDPNIAGISNEEDQLAILLVAKEHISIIGLVEQLEKIAKGTSSNRRDLNNFYWEYVFPIQLKREYGLEKGEQICKLALSGICSLKEE